MSNVIEFIFQAVVCAAVIVFAVILFSALRAAG